MNQRFLVSVGVLIVLIAIGWLAAIPVAAQGPSATAQSYTAPRTPDGQPDLQGSGRTKPIRRWSGPMT